METEALNIAAVVAGAVAGLVFGAVIYHPRVLGTVWTNGSGVQLDRKPTALAFLLQILALLCLAVVVGMTATVNFLGTAVLAIAGAALFVAAVGVQSKTTGAVLTDVLYVAGSGVLMILMQGLL